MSARKSSIPRALGALVGFVGMSAVAGLLVTAMITPALAVTGMAANNTIGVFEGLPEYLKIGAVGQASTMYATRGGQPVEIAKFYSENRQEIGWDQIPQVVKDAAIGTEDPRFYEHGGVDIIGTTRGALETYVRHSTQGGSSITQQYVKNVLIAKCEKYDKNVDDKGRQKELNREFQSCYDDATAQTPARKLREIKYAIGLEKRYTKDQILQGYLNIAGFGGIVYGIQAAAKHYFNVDAANLDLDQAATLIAIVNNPNNLRIDRTAAQLPANNPDNGFKETLARRNYVLDRMLVAKKITRQQHDEAKAKPITPSIYNAPNGCATAATVNGAFFCNVVVNRILGDSAFGKTADDRDNFLREGGLKIYTTLNLDLQDTAQAALSKYIPPTRPGLDLGAASTAVELNTGRVITMVQNRPYDVDNTDAPGVTQINYATDASDGGSTGFQTGSTYKAFTLLDWVAEGHSIYDTVNAAQNEVSIPASRFHNSCGPVGDKPWTVGNDTSGEGGRISVINATAESVNTAFAAMGQRLDLCKINQTAEDLGIHLAFPYQRDDNGDLIRDNGKLVKRSMNTGPAMILGTNELSPLTLATAYGGIGNGGKWCTSVVMDKITKEDGTEVPVPKTTCTQGVDPEVIAQAVPALQKVITGGTATAMNPRDGVPILGKTGTTDHAEQNWMATSTSKVATATWVGNVQGVEQANGTYANKNFGDIYFDGIWGRNIKFNILKPVQQAIDQAYGGEVFAKPTSTRITKREVTIPDLTGKSSQDAQTILGGLGFRYQDGGQVDSTRAQGVVVATTPAAGNTAAVGSPVTVRTSNGALVPLPNVAGGETTYVQAQKTLEALGMKTVPNGSTDPNALVTEMNPTAGSAVRKGTMITLTVRSG